MFQYLRLTALASIAALFLGLTPSDCAAKMQLYGVNYNMRNGPDWAPVEQKCKSASEVDQDLAVLAGITARIRIFSLTDCNQGEVVLAAAKKYNLQVQIGLWVSADSEVFTAEKVKLIQLLDAGKVITPETVPGIHVGSEALYRKEVTEAQIVGNMKHIKSALVARGLSIPVTIADIGDVYLAHPGLVNEVDYVAANGFPFWERVGVDGAADYFYSRMKPLMDRAAELNKDFVISETGWASQGSHVNASVASPANAAKYLQDFHKLAVEHGWKYFYFSAFDELWKNEQQGLGHDGVEAHFGLFTRDRQLKPEYAALELGAKEEDGAADLTPTPTSAPPSSASPIPGCIVKPSV